MHDDPDDQRDAAAALLGAAGGVLGGGDGFALALERWAADAGVDEAARQRARQRWLRIQAEESASFSGTLLDLAERGRTVGLDVGDQRLRGRIVGLGADFLALRSDRDQHVIVRTDRIGVVRSEPGEPAVAGDRTAVVDADLAGVLAPLAAERPEVLVRTRAGTLVRGELRSAGTDLLRLRVPGEPPTPAWVPLTAVDLLVLDP